MRPCWSKAPGKAGCEKVTGEGEGRARTGKPRVHALEQLSGSHRIVLAVLELTNEHEDVGSCHRGALRGGRLADDDATAELPKLSIALPINFSRGRQHPPWQDVATLLGDVYFRIAWQRLPRRVQAAWAAARAPRTSRCRPCTSTHRSVRRVVRRSTALLRTTLPPARTRTPSQRRRLGRWRRGWSRACSLCRFSVRHRQYRQHWNSALRPSSKRNEDSGSSRARRMQSRRGRARAAARPVWARGGGCLKRSSSAYSAYPGGSTLGIACPWWARRSKFCETPPRSHTACLLPCLLTCSSTHTGVLLLWTRELQMSWANS